MSASQVSGVLLPFGGAIRLDMPGYLAPPSGVSSVTISRAVSGISAYLQLYSGAPLPVWFDPGDGLPAPLSAASGYTYRIVDQRGTTDTPFIVPAMAIATQPDQMTEMLIRMLQCGVSNTVLGPGITAPNQVSSQMPQGGWNALPFIVVNLDLQEQSDTPLGQDVQQTFVENVWNITVHAKRLWRVSVFGRSAKERDFWRDTVLAIWQSMLPTVFLQIGMDVRHKFLVTAGTDADEWMGHVPGFYWADLALSVDGIFPVAIMAPYGTIASFVATTTFPDGVQQVEDIPAPSGINRP